MLPIQRDGTSAYNKFKRTRTCTFHAGSTSACTKTKTMARTDNLRPVFSKRPKYLEVKAGDIVAPEWFWYKRGDFVTDNHVGPC